MAVFKNPNDPAQPQAGVYRWFFKKDDKIHTLYVGNAGANNTILPKGTLYRGVSELQRSPFSSDRGRSLDTDFIVGTSINLIENRLSYECQWEHISNNPVDEYITCRKYLPLLQQETNCRIKLKYKFHCSNRRWHFEGISDEDKKKMINEATELIYSELKNEINKLK